MLLTAPELMTHLRCSLGHLYRLARRHRIPSHSFGRLVRFELTDVLEASRVVVRERKPKSAGTRIALLRLQQKARRRGPMRVERTS